MWKMVDIKCEYVFAGSGLFIYSNFVKKIVQIL